MVQQPDTGCPDLAERPNPAGVTRAALYMQGAKPRRQWRDAPDHSRVRLTTLIGLQNVCKPLDYSSGHRGHHTNIGN